VSIEQLITEHLDIWTAADTEKKSGRGRSSGSAGSVYGIKKLRELILELAVRGKLVPQDPSDEPASELLKRIAAEKAKLVAEGKIKKSKPLEPIANDEKPFELPVGWEWVRLDDVAYSQAGFAFKSNRFNELGSGLPLIRIRDVGQPFTGTYFDGEYRDEFVVINGDYLISMDGEFRVAKWENEKALLNQRVSRLIFFGSEISESFLAETLQAQLMMLQGIKAYTTVDHLSGTQISNSIIGFPPYLEQQRIAAKINELMALCNQLENQHNNAAEAHEKLVTHLLGTLTQSQNAEDFNTHWQRISEHFDTLFTTEASIDALKQTLLQLAVMGKLVPQDPNDEPASELLKRIQAEKAKLIAEGKIKKDKPLAEIREEEKPFELPVGWEWVRFGVITHTRLGKMLDKNKNKGVNRPYLRNTNVQWFDFEIEDLKEMRFEDHELEEYRLIAGDLVICEGGEPGRCAIWQGQIDEMFIQKALHRARTMKGVLPEFLQLCLRVDTYKGYLNRFFTGVTIKHFSGEKLSIYPVPLPAAYEQVRIVAKVVELMILCDQLKSHFTEANQLQKKLTDVMVEQATA
jgi:type I restriction enzyme, S subunit